MSEPPIQPIDLAPFPRLALRREQAAEALGVTSPTSSRRGCGTTIKTNLSTNSASHRRHLKTMVAFSIDCTANDGGQRGFKGAVSLPRHRGALGATSQSLLAYQSTMRQQPYRKRYETPLTVCVSGSPRRLGCDWQELYCENLRRRQHDL